MIEKKIKEKVDKKIMLDLINHITMGKNANEEI